MAAGSEPYPILWSLTRELRLANHIAASLRQGVALPQALEQAARVHGQVPFLLKKKQAHYQQFIYRLGERTIRHCIKKAAQADRLLKGAVADDGQPASQALANLIVAMSTGSTNLPEPGASAPLPH